jgi:mRNA interferase RelE/StbE
VATYRVEIARRAQRSLDALDAETRAHLLARITGLEQDPRPPGCKKLKGAADTYRIRAGAYRVVYAIEDARLLVLVVRIGHRREVYR